MGPTGKHGKDKWIWANVGYDFKLLPACKFLLNTTHIVFFLKPGTVEAMALCNKKNGQTQF